MQEMGKINDLDRIETIENIDTNDGIGEIEEMGGNGRVRALVRPVEVAIGVFRLPRGGGRGMGPRRRDLDAPGRRPRKPIHLRVFWRTAKERHFRDSVKLNRAPARIRKDGGLTGESEHRCGRDSAEIHRLRPAADAPREQCNRRDSIKLNLPPTHRRKEKESPFRHGIKNPDRPVLNIP